jgi:hypothetical protein
MLLTGPIDFGRGDLPTFRYHPDPVATGEIVANKVVCISCNQLCPYTYTGPVYAEAELNDRLCPWCIADGSAAAKLDAQFTDALWAVPEEVSAEVTEEVLCRTPGFSGWQQERWLHHCGDAAEYHGRVGTPELVRFADALDVLRLEHEGLGWEPNDIDHYLSSLDKDGQPTAYLFRCRVCRTRFAYSDFT